MKYSTVNPQEAQRAKEYLELLIGRKKTVEIVAVSPKRSLNQNSYLHLLLGAYSAHFGFQLHETKYLYKRLNQDIYAYVKNGTTFLRSSADLSKEEMTRSIERFRQHSAEQDYPLPTATDKGWLQEIENAIEQAKYYL